jgi:DinB superfamily
MPHPLVLQLHFTRSEFQRGLVGLTDEEARRRFEPMNCISWNIAHLAWQEQGCWLWFAQGKVLLPHLSSQFGYGVLASTPPLDEAWAAWHTITEATDLWLDTVTTEKLQEYAVREGEPTQYQFGDLLQRVIYHYWYHLGENMAIRQVLGHTDLPQFVGNIEEVAPFRPE